ncbi:peptidoglycan DD-metalloendopeptidase family protein (plasmid) [Cytobacillus firmus]|uniref:peptidoglycan DD-metalloendopeptidase family protein n=1 Tax=Bacillaceae TaxID=186817 RepID=UPI001FD01F2F|nr:peptidoglycan DD-metalloendopeptidase family protein [Bacillus sp. NTK034]
MNDQNSNDIGKQTAGQMANIGKSALKNKRVRNMFVKGLKAQYKLLRLVLQKLIPAIIKSVVGFIGPYAFLIILLIILLLIIMESVVQFDTFGRGGERNEAEKLFDQTIKEVIDDRSEEVGSDLYSVLSEGQNKSPYQPVNQSYIAQVLDMIRPSDAIPPALYSYKSLKSKTYVPWHKKYKNQPMKTKADRQKAHTYFYNVINKEIDYYFKDPTMQVEYQYGTSSGEKVMTKTVTTCKRPVNTNTDGINAKPEDNKEIEYEIESSTAFSTKDMPSRQVVTEASAMYATALFSYSLSTGDWVKEGSQSTEECTVDTYKKYTLYQLDDSGAPNVTYNGESLLSFLIVDNPEGILARLVKPKDLEYVLEQLKEIDDNFPKFTIDFEGLVECYYKNLMNAASCIGPNLKGSAFSGLVGSGGGGWYPEEYKELYERAAAAYNVDWWILASIHAQETEFSTNPAATDPSKGSSVGAKGHFQFMGLTWLGWSYKGGNGLSVTRLGNIEGPLNLVVDLISSVQQIKKHGGYGVDANNNGKASPWELEDAAFTAAKYLAASGYKKEDEAKIKKAIRSYNHSNSYVNEVYNRGIMFKNGVPSGGSIPVAEGSFTFPATGRITSGFGNRSGGTHYGVDIGGGGRPTVPVVAAADGVVSRSYLSGSYGNVVYIKHKIDGLEFETVYAHLAQRGIAQGKTVKKGDFIGYMGNTGQSYGKHLHFEIHQPSWNAGKSNAKNPLLYIPTPPEK